MLRRSRRRDSSASGAVASATCEHLESVNTEPTPDTPGQCMDCANVGEDTWAHLRMCLTCGHVACCDSSPHQHATEHFRRTGHPVMRSAEPGETWRWCYIDHRLG
jgi:uncharacterized UBP type Zn finger protein